MTLEDRIKAKIELFKRGRGPLRHYSIAQIVTMLEGLLVEEEGQEEHRNRVLLKALYDAMMED